MSLPPALECTDVRAVNLANDRTATPVVANFAVDSDFLQGRMNLDFYIVW